MIRISCRASASVIFPAVARAPSASRRQWSASYVGCTISPHLPPRRPNAETSIRFPSGTSKMVTGAAGLSPANQKPLQTANHAGVGGKTIVRSCRCVATERSHQSSHTSLRCLRAHLWQPRPAFGSPGAAHLGRAVANRTDHSPLPSWTSPSRNRLHLR